MNIQENCLVGKKRLSLRINIKNPDSSPASKYLGEERPGLHCKDTQFMEYNKSFFEIGNRNYGIIYQKNKREWLRYSL